MTLRRMLAAVAVMIPMAGLAQGSPPAQDAPTASEDPPPPPDPAPGRPPIPSFQTRSNTRAGGPANELNTNDGRATERPPGGSVSDAATGRRLFHGNFCGYGNNGPDLAPVDALDAACKRHDQCYDRAGHPSCACDAQLKREAFAVSEMKDLSREVRTRAASVIEATGVMKCQNP